MASDSGQFRTVEDVDHVVTLAKLNPKDLMPVTQTVIFGPETVDHDRIRILEVTPALADFLTSGAELVMRGDPEESVVLCSETETFDVREAETSNSILLVDKILFPDEVKDEVRKLETSKVEGIFHRYLELKKCKPKLSKLRMILAERHKPYGGPSSGDDQDCGVTFSHLENSVQCSERELEQGLQDLKAICIGDKWYYLDPDYHMRVLSMICNFVEENGWSWHGGEIKMDVTIGSFEGSESVPKVVAEQIFKFYFELFEDGFKVKVDDLCRFYGEYLLQAGTTFELGDFLKLWQQAVPGGEEDLEFPTNIEQLVGISLVDNDKRTIRYFPEWKLPEAIYDRLAKLFEVRPKWTADDIAPYVLSLTTPKLNVNALLTKYARASTINGVKHFGAKHGK